jgi:hypothetical protein
MELAIKGNTIELKGKEINELDKRVIDFIKLLEPVDYVIISGYIGILFGRSRNTEDVDIFINFKQEKELSAFLKRLEKKSYYIINALTTEEACELLNEGVPIRIAKEGEIMPNFELKLPKTETDRLSFENKMIVKLGEYGLNTSSLELQIAYKLFLGSEKDYGDAIHLYDISEEYLNKAKFHSFIRMLGVSDKVVKKVLGVV